LNSTELNKYRLMDKDFLINRVTKLKDGAGKSILVKNPIKDLIYEGNLIRFRINEDLITPEFFEYYSKSRLYFNYIQSTCKTLSLTSIDQDVISKIPVILPSKDEQKEIVNVLSPRLIWEHEIYEQTFDVLGSALSLGRIFLLALLFIVIAFK
jgi:type I restriction enzyme, S subunit